MRSMLAVVCLLVPIAAAAQGVQTGTLRGTVITADGLTLPGATVTIASPALQGQRDAVTETSGDYTFRGLPPGEYEVTFALSGMTTLQRKATVPLGGATEINVTMAPAAV